MLQYDTANTDIVHSQCFILFSITGSDDGTLQVTLYVKDYDVLAEKSNNVLDAAVKEEGSNHEDEGVYTMNQ